MYLSFPSLPSIQTNVPQINASFNDSFSAFTKYLLDSGKNALADIRSSPLAGRINWKIAVPVCLHLLSGKKKQRANNTSRSIKIRQSNDLRAKGTNQNPTARKKQDHTRASEKSRRAF